MGGLLRVSEAASLALHSMALLAGSSEGPVSTHEMAERLGVSEAHLSKVLQRLAKAGLVRSTRGPGGGFRLTKRSSRISLLEIYEAIEGRLTSSECLLGRKVCGGGGCIFGDVLRSVSRQIREYLSRTRLSQFSDLCVGKTTHA